MALEGILNYENSEIIKKNHTKDVFFKAMPI
jgi:hypothetical protein